MLELVSNGPRIPVDLMNETESGHVVFFCGAGVSASQGSNLPSFAGLVEQIYAEHHLKPDAVELEALHDAARNTDHWRPYFDKALGLLERGDRLGAQALRRTVIECLSKPASGDLNVHAALIALAQTEQGQRLITTNFDNRFVEAGWDERSVDAAPKLPVPKPHSWSSLVHLHGRIAPHEDSSNLILTAADFGRAYLTERWAARFVTELFREFTVVFVGYSVGDPVMSYLVDALAAERAKGARIANAFAFAHHDGTDAGLNKTRDGWLAKNVKPILYSKEDSHRLLAETLIEWARIRNDPFQARSQIALNDISKLPVGPNDPVVERVAWALQDPVAAKALAVAPAIVDEDEFPKVERWLEVLQEEGLMHCPAANANLGGPNSAPEFVRLVDNGLQPRYPYALDITRGNLAHWIARHIHVPQVLGWVLRNGGHLHPGLRQEIQIRLAKPEANIPPRLRRLWTVLVDYEPTGPWKFVWTRKHYEAADSEGERTRIEDEAVQSMAPRLIVLPGPSSHLEFTRYVDKRAGPLEPVELCGHLKLIVGNEDANFQLEKIFEDEALLSRHAETLTGHLEQALVLAQEDDGVYPNSLLYRRSIASHEQDPDDYANGLNRLIDLVRDSYRAIGSAGRARAENLLHRWVLSGRPLFQRLALHALAENRRADIGLAKKLLISGRQPGIWNWELQRETLRFFRLAGSRLPRSLRAEIVRAIHAGPKPRPKNRPPNCPEWIRREKALRLHKLAASGARLDKRSRALADTLPPAAQGEDEERDEFTRPRGEGQWVGEEEFAPSDLLEGSMDDVARALENEHVEEYQLRGLARAKPAKIARALRRLATHDKWPAMYWEQFLWSVSDGQEQSTRRRRLLTHVVRMLAQAPDDLFTQIGPAGANLVKELASAYETEREQEIQRLWPRVWAAAGTVEAVLIVGMDDPITNALNHPAGKLADAAVARLLKYKPKAGDGLPATVRPYFDAIAGDRNGHLGRVMLATRLHYLFAVDPDWVADQLIPLLSPGRSEEASNLWYAYGWSRTIGPSLLQALKEPLLQILQDDGLRPRTARNLTMVVMAICLEAPNELTDDEVDQVVETMSEDGLKTVLTSLQARLGGEPAERAQSWRKKVQPWLQKHWPRAAVRNTAGTSSVLLNVLANCGEAYPEAADWCLDYLKPTEGDVFRLHKSELARQFPEPTLEVLDRIIGPNSLPGHHRHMLDQILDQMSEAMPNIEANRRFQRLYRAATE